MVLEKVTIEACVNSVESAIEAQTGGAQRVELCDNLYEGGTTPSYGAIALAREYLKIDLNVIIRPRGGDFCYSNVEFDIMKSDIQTAKTLGVDGIVIGILDADGTVDSERSKRLIELAAPLKVTFHRAFDVTADPFGTLEELIDLGVHRILTSGQQPSATRGIDLIAQLVEQAGDRVVIMPGVGVDPTNIAGLIKKTRASEYHVLAQKQVPSPMEYRNQEVFMGTDPEFPEYDIISTDAEQIRIICQKAGQTVESLR